MRYFFDLSKYSTINQSGYDTEYKNITHTAIKFKERMKKQEFKNTRFNPDIIPFHNLAKEMAKAVGYTADLKIDKKLAQLLRLRVAQKNECAYCIILHAKAAREIGISEAKVDNISSWYNSDLYTEIEKVTLAYCDALNKGVGKHFNNYHHDLKVFFGDQEIAEIAAVIINMNLWTRLKLAQGETPVISD